jgi:hypothetical protein
LTDIDDILQRIDELIFQDPEPDTPEGEELISLIGLVNDYDDAVKAKKKRRKK